MTTPDTPFTTFRFEVVIDLHTSIQGFDSPLCDGAFAECDGLDMTMQVKTIEAGGVNDRQIHLIGPVSNSQVTLKRGMTSNLQLWNWFSRAAVPGSDLKARTQITMRDTAGNPVIDFTLTNCLPVKMKAPSLNARDGLVAIEELSMAYEQLTVAPHNSSGGLGNAAGSSASAGLQAGASLSAGIGT